nr:MAG TPA: hypothetical protein [Caudoviricetes sp.]DAR53856.1 MAG TPA: hypothetical protein [Caudoviricetes sp.]DAX52643.1 MAG TPA: hypothetical protein [Caudoviricetes sp.]
MLIKFSQSQSFLIPYYEISLTVKVYFVYCRSFCPGIK